MAANITAAVAEFLPIVRVLIVEAQGSGASNQEKHDAVAATSQKFYEMLQKSGKVPALAGIPWQEIEPFVVPVEEGIISVVVGFLQSLAQTVASGFYKLFHKEPKAAATPAVATAVGAAILALLLLAAPAYAGRRQFYVDGFDEPCGTLTLGRDSQNQPVAVVRDCWLLQRLERPHCPPPSLCPAGTSCNEDACGAVGPYPENGLCGCH